ncbi:unnamed protein product [Adineta steineri]|uniref:Uncharacterized protein n=1 Tax=Adineta steineri TaxID=433720 RepID=A0A819L062_9BILA|nr:unnamed protein product [Adineta steineri]CAF3954783.1 unnamed protein product [Adineta steineri]
MEFELAPIERLPDNQDCTGELSIISTLSAQQIVDDNNEILKEVAEASKSEGEKITSQKKMSKKIFVSVFILYVIVAMIAGILLVYFTSPRPSITCNRTFKRTMKSSLLFDSQPRCVAAGDINNDNEMDVIVANSGTNTIGIFLSTGNGDFKKQQTYSTGSGSQPYSIVINDFNNDNYSDVAVANYGTNSIGIYFTNGNGNDTFTHYQIFSLGSSRPLSLTAGDFNEDNNMDLAVVTYGTNSVNILLGFGNGSFQNQITYFTGYDSVPSSLQIGDFNKDNHLDIVVANSGTNNIGIFFGYGNGTFMNQTTYTTTSNSNPSSIVVADFNNDNQLDIAVTNTGIGSLGIFFGQNNGTFAVQTLYYMGFNVYPRYITADDFNKDNACDIAIIDSENDRIYVFLGYGNGSFSTITTYDTTSGSTPYWMIVTDFNKNNQSDAVIANYEDDTIFVLLDYSYMPSVRQKNYNVGPTSIAKAVAVTDLNNDHIIDLIFSVGTKIVTLMGLANGTFDATPKYSIDIGCLAQDISVGDLNNDKKMDIVTANRDCDSISVFLGLGDGKFANMTTYSPGIGSIPNGIALGDVNNDNRLDIISANYGYYTISIYLGNGDGLFSSMENDSIDLVYYSPSAIGIEDINNDTYLDLIVAIDDGYIFIYLGNGNNTFVYLTNYSGDGSAYSIALADFNNDAHLDIVVTSTDASDIWILLAYGNGTFQDPTTYSTGFDSQPYYSAAGDFNNDNNSDIVTSNLITNEIVIFHGDGTGKFSPPRIYSTGSGTNPYGITTVSIGDDKQVHIIVAFWGTGDIGVLTEYDAADFVNVTAYSTGSVLQPFAVAIGDFNHDNRSDIVVANSGTDNLSIILNSNNNTFNINMTYFIGTGIQPQYVLTCDINNDNQTDIISANSESDSISVIMGYGNGTFAQEMIYSTGSNSYPTAIASGDFNNDTRLDLVIANQGTDTIGIFIGYNYTSFQSQVTLSINDSLGPYAIVNSDFDNDNYLDIAATFSDTGEVGIFLHSNNGNFTTMITYSTGEWSYPCGIDVGDFNNDNQSDIIVAISGTGVGILLGLGNGSFDAIITYSTGDYSSPYLVTVGDINNDDRLDIVACDNGGHVIILLGYSNGSFSVINTYSNGIFSNPMDVTVIDIDNDGLLDIIVVNQNTNNIGIFFGNGDGNFENQLTYSTGVKSWPYAIAVGDFNSDNHTDIAIVLNNKNNVGILLGYGNRTLPNMVTYSTGPGSIPSNARVGDFNNDNHLDIAVANSGTNNLVVLFGFGDGTFLLGTAYSSGLQSQPNQLTIGDFNNDNQLDIATINTNTNNIGISFGYESEPFATVTPYTTGGGSQPHSVAVDDLNKDGWLDIVVANFGNDNIGILFGQRDGMFSSMMTYSTGNGSAPYSVVVFDFNNDTYLDIATTASATNYIVILLGYGNGTFANEVTYFTGTDSRPYTIGIGDFNNDSILDIVVANSGTSNIFLLYGYGNGSFGNETTYSLGYLYNPYSIAVKDLNGDEWVDFAVACYNTDHVETFIQMC